MAKKFFTNESFTTLIDEFKKYADAAASKVKNDLLNGAGGAYDTLKELGDLIDDNHDAIDALEIVATSKADASAVAYIDENDNETVILGGSSNLPSAEEASF